MLLYINVYRLKDKNTRGTECCIFFLLYFSIYPLTVEAVLDETWHLLKFAYQDFSWEEDESKTEGRLGKIKKWWLGGNKEQNLCWIQILEEKDKNKDGFK